MIGYVRNHRLIKISGDKKHGYTKGKLCPKGYNYLSYVYHQDRLRYPMIQRKRGSGEWSRIPWSEAIDIISHKIIELYDRYGSNLSVALNKYSGNVGILHNCIEGFFNSLGKTTRAVGSPCWPSGLDASIYDFGDYQNSDPKQLTKADVIILWGCNPAWTSIHSVRFLYEAKSRGAKIITIDPIYTATAKKSDIFVQIYPGTDGALALALAKVIYEKNGVDWEFIKKYTFGFPYFLHYIQSLDMKRLLKECGLTDEIVEKIAWQIIKGGKTIIWIGFGFQRNKNGGQNIRAINALMAMTGNIGKEGAGVLYAQQSSNQFTNKIMKYYKDGFDEKTCIRSVDINNFGKAIKEWTDPPIKMLWIACRNLLSQTPELKLLEEQLLDLELIVTVDHFLTPTAKFSDIVLPATTIFEEWEIVYSYWHHWIAINEPAIPPYFESKSDLEIVKMLAKRLNELRPNFSTFPYDKSVQDFIEEEFTEDIYKKLKIKHWKELLDGPRRMDLPKIAWIDKKFKTPSGKFEFYSERAMANGKFPIAYYPFSDNHNAYPFIMISCHSQFQINSQFKNLFFDENGENEPIVYIHPSSARKKGINNGEWISVFNEKGEIKVKCVYSNKVHPDIVLAQGEFNLINQLISYTPTDMGEISSGFQGMAYNSTKVDIKKLNQ